MQSYSDTMDREDSEMEGAGSTTEQFKDTAQKAMDKTQGTVTQLADKAKTQVKTQVATGKDKAAESLEQVTQALHQTGQDLTDKGQDKVGQVIDSAASQIDHLAGYLRNQDVDDLLNDLEDAARRNPAMFVGGAFVLGFALARFLKSSRPEGGRSYDQRSYSSTAAMGSSRTAADRASIGTAGTAGTVGAPGTYGAASYGASGVGTGIAGATGMGTVGGTTGTVADATSGDIFGDTSGATASQPTPGTADALGSTWNRLDEQPLVTDAELDEEDMDITVASRPDELP